MENSAFCWTRKVYENNARTIKAIVGKHNIDLEEKACCRALSTAFLLYTIQPTEMVSSQSIEEEEAAEEKRMPLEGRKEGRKESTRRKTQQRTQQLNTRKERRKKERKRKKEKKSVLYTQMCL